MKVKAIDNGDGTYNPIIQFNKENEALAIQIIGQELLDKMKKECPVDLDGMYLVLDQKVGGVRVWDDLPTKEDGITILEMEMKILEPVIEEKAVINLAIFSDSQAFQDLPEKIQDMLMNTAIGVIVDTEGNFGTGIHCCRDEECRETHVKKNALEGLTEMIHARNEHAEKAVEELLKKNRVN